MLGLLHNIPVESIQVRNVGDNGYSIADCKCVILDSCYTAQYGFQHQ